MRNAERATVSVDRQQLMNTLGRMPFGGAVYVPRITDIDDGALLLDWLDKLTDHIAKYVESANRRERELGELKRQRDSMRRFLGTGEHS